MFPRNAACHVVPGREPAFHSWGWAMLGASPQLPGFLGVVSLPTRRRRGMWSVASPAREQPAPMTAALPRTGEWFPRVELAAGYGSAGSGSAAHSASRVPAHALSGGVP